MAENLNIEGEDQITEFRNDLLMKLDTIRRSILILPDAGISYERLISDDSRSVFIAGLAQKIAHAGKPNVEDNQLFGALVRYDILDKVTNRVSILLGDFGGDEKVHVLYPQAVKSLSKDLVLQYYDEAAQQIDSLVEGFRVGASHDPLEALKGSVAQQRGAVETAFAHYTGHQVG